MGIEKNNIESSLVFTQHIPLINEGVANLKKLLIWPEASEPSDLQFITPSLYEYVTFCEGVRNPFYRVINAKFSNHTNELFDYLKEKEVTAISRLTHDEAFDFLCVLGNTNTRYIIDSYNHFPSNVYTEVINSIHTQDKAAFSTALKETDCQNLMGVLWTMRYLLFGIQSEKDVKTIKRGKRIQFENLWLVDTELASFFRNIPQEQEEQFIKERIKLLSGFDTKSIARRQRIGGQQYDSRAVAQTKPYLHYIDYGRKSWKQFLSEPENNETTSTALSSITFNCKLQTYKILLSALRSHKDAIEQRLGNPGGNTFTATIEQKWENEDWGYVEWECQDFLNFINLSLQQMKSVYLMIEGFLSDADKDLLNWIVSLYTNDGQQEALVGNYQKVSQEGHSIDNDNTIPKGKWYVTVLNSKLKGNNSKEKNTELSRCLSLLYRELTKEGSNLIDTATPKDLFIYRFSGKGESYPLTTKIKWRGKNVLLGHIVRCLLSDKRNAPEDMGIASEFFESRSGNAINLASAKQVPVNDYEKERNNLDPNFVEAVELLRRCGFINVELTSKRR